MRFNTILDIERKELALFFTSAIGYLFLGVFLVATLFVFFWVETFFARNISDVRPMFEWLPILLIFLSAALTMRMWSEERRSGTMEFVATLPVSSGEFVVGKFFACVSLLAVALLLTLPLPITVDLLADLDWGPVLAGYVAAIMLGSAYIAIGLFVSARTNSQIVSLILAVLICAAFYLVGSDNMVNLFPEPIRNVLVLLGSGSRFESITRGLLDFRDLFFYFSVVVGFLVLNIFALEKDKWAEAGSRKNHTAWYLGTGLVVLNLLLANVWLSSINFLRLDVTDGKIYSISSATESYLQQLQEPLLIRGYFTDQTHPLLAPLVPRMKDLLKEYEVAGDGRVRVEIVDPVSDPEAENLANTKYGIRAVPFQLADRHQSSLVNSYFDVLIEYGDEYEILSFRDLIEVKVAAENNLDVRLKNPEFDLTRSIKKVLYGFQGGSSIFNSISDPVEFVGYLSSADKLPQALVELRPQLDEALQQLSQDSQGKLSVSIVDPEAGDGSVAMDIASRFGFQPMSASLFDDIQFYYYLTLRGGANEIVVQIPLPEDLSSDGFKRGIEEGLKRFAVGLLKTVVLATPAPTPPYLAQQGAPRTNEFNELQGLLTSDFNVTTDDLTSGVVPAGTDLLMVIDPDNYNALQQFAIDQFLMKGGTVVIASSSFAAVPSQGSLMAQSRQSGLAEWLSHHGLTLEPAMVMDPQNSAFPVPVTRQAGGFTFNDLEMLDYPYFVDVRQDGIDEDSPMFAGLDQMTLSWPSPITLTVGESVQSTTLLQSSPASWTSSDTNIMPKFDSQGLTPFAPTSQQGRQPLAVLLQGKFSSYFADQPSPLLDQPAEPVENPENAAEVPPKVADGPGIVSSVIDRSPESARLLLFASNDFLADQTLQMLGSANGTLYTNSVQLMTNVVDWALEDNNLIGIRSRGNFNRTLPGMEVAEQTTIEYINYFLAALLIVVVWGVARIFAARRSLQHRTWIQEYMPTDVSEMSPGNQAGNLETDAAEPGVAR